MSVYKRGGKWWYEFSFQGQRIREAAHTTSKTAAIQIDANAVAKWSFLEAASGNKSRCCSMWPRKRGFRRMRIGAIPHERFTS